LLFTIFEQGRAETERRVEPPRVLRVIRLFADLLAGDVKAGFPKTLLHHRDRVRAPDLDRQIELTLAPFDPRTQVPQMRHLRLRESLRQQPEL
jgi:hypothetical protein